MATRKHFSDMIFCNFKIRVYLNLFFFRIKYKLYIFPKRKKMLAARVRRSLRLTSKHIHPYVLCIIDMQPIGFDTSVFIIENVLQLVREAIINKAFIVVAQFKGCGKTHTDILNEIQEYPYKIFITHNKNNKSKPIFEALNGLKIFVRQLKICGVNTEYCVKDTVHGLAKKFFNISIIVIERACNGTDRTMKDALYKMRTFYKNVKVL